MRRADLIQKAMEAKLSIKHRIDNSYLIRNGSVAIRFYEDGKQHRADVRLDLARNMTVVEAAKALKLI